jgi:hypothetical protein
MRKPDPVKRRTLHAVRVRRTSPVPNTPTTGTEELSDYELLERRSHQLEMERARGGFGTPQPPDADTPLLFPRFAANPVSQQKPGTLPKRKR